MTTVKEPIETTSGGQEESFDYAANETDDACYEDQSYAAEETSTYASYDTGTGGAPNDAGGFEGAGGATYESETADNSELMDELGKHAAVEILDKIIVETLKLPEKVVTLFVLVLEIASGCGDTSCESLKLIKYSAGCDGDHDDGGSCWSGPQRDTKEEALADARAHLLIYPDHEAQLY